LPGRSPNSSGRKPPPRPIASCTSRPAHASAMLAENSWQSILERAEACIDQWTPVQPLPRERHLRLCLGIPEGTDRTRPSAAPLRGYPTDFLRLGISPQGGAWSLPEVITLPANWSFYWACADCSSSAPLETRRISRRRGGADSAIANEQFKRRSLRIRCFAAMWPVFASKCSVAAVNRACIAPRRV